MDDENTIQPVLKKPEIKRDPEGRFERDGKGISKTAKRQKPSNEMLANFVKSMQGKRINNSDLIDPNPIANLPLQRRGRGRPKGSLGKATIALREQILQALDEVGGSRYLATLAIENSSAFAGLLGKVLPSTLAMSDSDDGKSKGITFQRIIVWPDGRREIEGVTPKQLPAPQQESIAHQPQVGENGSNEDDQA